MTKVVKLKNTVTKADIDNLGYFLAEAAEWIKKAEAIKKKIKKFGDGSYEGLFYRATCSEYDQKRLNMDAVRAKLSAQFIRANTTVTPCQKITVYSKQGKKLKKVGT
jgi:hypothetical protein